MTKAAKHPLPESQTDDAKILELARAIARGLALAHHNAQSIPEPANEN
ncbi:hypothetical protein [Thalassospira xiamenensis]|nr:hypothetical protein [Thalassospira xiamenensis]